MPLQLTRPSLSFLALIFGSCLTTFTVIAYKVVFQHHDNLDNAVISYFSQHKSPELIHIMVGVTFFGSSLFLIPAYLALAGYLIITKHYRHAIAAALISFVSWVLLSQIKILFHRHRPPLPLLANISTFSFPSAHAYSSLIFFSLLAFIVSKWQLPSLQKNILITLLLLCPFAVGLSRIILNVHYTTDVIAGYCLGTMWLVLSYVVFINGRGINKKIK